MVFNITPHLDQKTGNMLPGLDESHIQISWAADLKRLHEDQKIQPISSVVTFCWNLQRP